MNLRDTNVVLAHGFNVNDDGKSTIGKLATVLPFPGVQQVDYGWTGLLGVRVLNPRIAKLVAGMTEPGSVGIGHSNGCDILRRAAALGAPFKHLILINPALDSDISFSDQIEHIDVLHNPTDNVVTAAKFIPWSAWGDMGRAGYTGIDPRVVNHDTHAQFGATGHSGVFEDGHIDDLGRYITLLMVADRV